MIIEITVENKLEATLDRIAKENNTTSEKYVKEMIKSFLQGQRRVEILKRVQKKSLDELINLNL